MRGVQGSSLIKKKDNSPAKFRLITTHCCSVVGINQKKKNSERYHTKGKTTADRYEAKKGIHQIRGLIIICLEILKITLCFADNKKSKKNRASSIQKIERKFYLALRTLSI